MTRTRTRPFIARAAAAVAVAVAAGMLTGCAGALVQIKTRYNAEEHAAYAAKGANSVSGQAFLRQAGGGTVTCAGIAAVLFPDTPFFQETVDIASRGAKPDLAGQSIPKQDRSPLRNTVCDAQGNFVMEEVPAGQWILVTEVRWMAGPYSPQGGLLKKSVQVRDGATNRFILSDGDLYRAR